jgi:hypothetical protein
MSEYYSISFRQLFSFLGSDGSVQNCCLLDWLRPRIGWWDICVMLGAPGTAMAGHLSAVRVLESSSTSQTHVPSRRCPTAAMLYQNTLIGLPSPLSCATCPQTGTKSLAQSREVFVYIYTTSIADSSSFNPRCAKLPQDLRCRWF